MTKSLLKTVMDAKGIKIRHEDLAIKLECSRKTMYSNFIKGKWRASQRKVLKKLGII